MWTIFNVLAGLSPSGLNLFEPQFRRDSIRPCLFNYSGYGRLIHHDAAQTSEWKASIENRQLNCSWHEEGFDKVLWTIKLRRKLKVNIEWEVSNLARQSASRHRNLVVRC